MKGKKRLLSLVLALVMVLTLLPIGSMTAFAEGTKHRYKACPSCHSDNLTFGPYSTKCNKCGQKIYITNYFTCNGTGTDGCAKGGPGENGHAAPHTHSWAADWSGDDDYHWHACTGDGHSDDCLNDAGAAKAAHTWNDGEVTTEATYEAVGEMTYTCTVCGETKTEEIPQLANRYVFYNATTLGIKLSQFNPACAAKDAWKMVTPIDLTKDGETEYLLISGARQIIGKVIVTVNDGKLTVTAKTEKWATMKEPVIMLAQDVSELTGFDTEGKTVYDLDTEISIADDLGGAEKVILQLVCPVIIDNMTLDCIFYNYNSNEYAELVDSMKSIME